MNEIIALYQNQLLKELNSSIKLGSLVEIGDVSEKLDSEIIVFIEEILISNTGLFIQKSTKGQGIFYNTIIDGQKYLVNFNRDILSPSTIIFSIAHRDLSSAIKSSRRKSPLSFCGKYTHLQFFYSKAIENLINFGDIINTVENLVSTSNNWLANRALKVIGENYVISENIYNYIRNIIPNSELVENIWLYASFGSKSFYILDNKTIEIALKKLESLSQKIGTTPFRILIEILNKKIPYTETATFQIEKSSEESKDINMSQLGYPDNNNLYFRAEIEIFGEDAATVIPIYYGDKDKFSMAIPVKIKDDIIAAVTANREELTNQFKLMNSKLKQFANMVSNTKVKLETGKWGELGGGFLKGFLGI